MDLFCAVVLDGFEKLCKSEAVQYILIIAMIFLIGAPQAKAEEMKIGSPIFEDLVFVAKTLNGDLETLSKYAELTKLDYETFSSLSQHWQKLSLNHCEDKYLIDLELLMQHHSDAYYKQNSEIIWRKLDEKYAYCRRDYLNNHWGEIRSSIHVNYDRLK